MVGLWFMFPTCKNLNKTLQSQLKFLVWNQNSKKKKFRLVQITMAQVQTEPS